MHFEATGLIRSFLQSYAIRVSVGYPLGVIFQPEFREIPKSPSHQGLLRTASYMMGSLSHSDLVMISCYERVERWNVVFTTFWLCHSSRTHHTSNRTIIFVGSTLPTAIYQRDVVIMIKS